MRLIPPDDTRCRRNRRGVTSTPSRRFVALRFISSVTLLVSIFVSSTFTSVFCVIEAPARGLAHRYQESADFESQIRPLLQRACVGCHGPDKQKSGLRVDHVEFLLEGGERGPAIDRESPSQSRLLGAIEYHDVDLQMPPRSRLADADIDLLRGWLDDGAPWPDEPLPSHPKKGQFDLQKRRDAHWCWQPELTPIDGPSADADNIDVFITRRLEEQNLTPTAAAPLRVWLRRATFLLTGLPPTPDEQRMFLERAQESVGAAKEMAIDRLLASPRFGEHWGRHWLDLVRYAESYGHEFDYPIRHAWRYRDYVIRAFNDDIPYSQWVTEHLAGDLLANPRRGEDGSNESVLASAFWYLNQATHGPVDVRLDEAERLDNQIDVFSKGFLGLTVACARCHDHKFDAISTADFYALAGYLKGTRRQFAFLDPQQQIESKIEEIDSAHRAYWNELSTQLREVAQSDALRTVIRGIREVFFGTPTAASAPQPDQLLADFEGEDFGAWEASGEALASGPVTGTLPRQNRVSGWRGKGYVNTYLNGDGSRGQLRSPTFEVSRRYLHFLIGGGAHPGKTCVQLWVEGKLVKEATGRNNEALEPRHFFVEEWSGRQAHLRVIDDASDGWGHINVDHFVLSDSSAKVKLKQSIESVSRELACDLANLRRAVRFAEGSSVAWARQLRSATMTATDNDPSDAGGGDVDASSEMPIDLSSELHSWQSTGWAFQRPDTPTTAEALGVVTSTDSKQHAHSGRLARSLQGVLRSPDFSLDRRYIHTRVRSVRASVGAHGELSLRVIICGYVMDIFNPLLFERHRITLGDAPEWHWITQDFERYQGQRAHIEIEDSGDGFLELDRVVLSNDPHPPAGVTDCGPANTRTLSPADPSAVSPRGSVEQLALTIGEQLRRIADRQVVSAQSAHQISEALTAGLVPLPRRHLLESTFQRIQNLDSTLPQPVRALAALAGTPGDEYVFIRGDHRLRGPTVPRRFLQALGGDAAQFTGGDRKTLARAVLSHPLTYRVWVNRVWHHLFGRGIVATPDDFGVSGQAPTHPQLLHYLARHFRDDLGGSTKALLREVMLSETFGRDSLQRNAAMQERQPEWRGWQRMPMRRLPAESIRDSLLATSGVLDTRMYGAPIAVHLTPYMQGRGRPASGPLDGAGRRSIYTSVQRNFLSPFLLAFDMPLPHTTCGRRSVSNVPAQGLALMNSPLVHELSRRWGAELAADPRTTLEKVEHLFVTALGRPPTALESRQSLAFLESVNASRSSKSEPTLNAVEWGELCHVVFNLKEFIYLR